MRAVSLNASRSTRPWSSHGKESARPGWNSDKNRTWNVGRAAAAGEPGSRATGCAVMVDLLVGLNFDRPFDPLWASREPAAASGNSLGCQCWALRALRATTTHCGAPAVLQHDALWWAGAHGRCDTRSPDVAGSRRDDDGVRTCSESLFRWSLPATPSTNGIRNAARAGSPSRTTRAPQSRRQSPPGRVKAALCARR